MKIIISFLATVFLAVMTFAQEESASPAESTAPATEEKASATVEETPASKPAEAASPAAVKKAEAATSPKAAASAAATTTTAKPAAPGKRERAKTLKRSTEPSFSPTPGSCATDNGSASLRRSAKLRDNPHFNCSKGGRGNAAASFSASASRISLLGPN